MLDMAPLGTSLLATSTNKICGECAMMMAGAALTEAAEATNRTFGTRAQSALSPSINKGWSSITAMEICSTVPLKQIRNGRAEIYQNRSNYCGSCTQRFHRGLLGTMVSQL